MRFKIHKIPFVNYVGQIRIYSLIDLILMLLAFHAGKYELAGAVLLHLGFLAYLEFNHNHNYRKVVPSLTWVILAALGVFFFQHIEVVGYLLFSYLYTLKNKKNLGICAPLFRGLQSFFIAAGILGYDNFGLLIVVISLLTFRNFAGDVRDIEKDKKEGLRTMPIIFGMKKSIKWIHLFALLLTTTIWFSFLDLKIYWLMAVFVIQILSYEITPR